jgi:hypothetical protein
MRAEMADSTISELLSHLCHELELESSDPDCLKSTKVGLIIDMIQVQTDAIEGVIFDTREYLASVLPVIFAIGSVEGFGTIFRNSFKLPENLKRSGFDAAYIDQARRKKEQEKNQTTDNPDKDMLADSSEESEGKLYQLYSDELRRKGGLR